MRMVRRAGAGGGRSDSTHHGDTDDDPSHSESEHWPVWLPQHDKQSQRRWMECVDPPQPTHTWLRCCGRSRTHSQGGRCGWSWCGCDGAGCGSRTGTGSWSCPSVRRLRWRVLWSAVTTLSIMVVMASVVGPMAWNTLDSLAGATPLAFSLTVTPNSDNHTDMGLRHEGRHCVHHRYRSLSSLWHGRGHWTCFDCDHGRCKGLTPRGRCRPSRRNEWDSQAMPRSVSQYDPTNDQEVEYRTLSTLGRYTYQSQPQCSGSLLTKACFDVSRCRPRRENATIPYNSSSSSSSSGTPITVFVNSTRPNPLLDYAMAHSVVVRVDRPQDACLSIVFPGTYTSVDDMLSARHFHTTNGRNNLMYDMSRYRFPNTKRLSSDAPISLFHIGFAAVASESLTSAMVRPGFDQILPLERRWARPVPPDQLDIHRNRTWLLSFRGSIKDRIHPYNQHRYLAAEYWDTSRGDVFVDVQCIRTFLYGAVSHTYHPYAHDNESPTVYTDLLLNSVFGFCPGGSGVSSYRLGEVLSAAGIPVVTHDLVLPLAPELDWSRCAIRVSEARIVDLPRRLRLVSATEIRERQTECWRLVRAVWGDVPSTGGSTSSSSAWTSDPRVTFAKAMEVWGVRVANALERQERLREINRDV